MTWATPGTQTSTTDHTNSLPFHSPYTPFPSLNYFIVINMIKFLFSTSKAIGRPVYIVAAKRTAIGAFNGRLSSFAAPELGGLAVRGAIDSINLDPKEVD